MTTTITSTSRTTVAAARERYLEANGRECWTINGGDQALATVLTLSDGTVAVVDGNGYGRMRWSLNRPDGDYCTADSKAEAIANL